MPNAGPPPKTLVMATERMSDEEFRFLDTTAGPDAVYAEARRAREAEDRLQADAALARELAKKAVAERDAGRAEVSRLKEDVEVLHAENIKLRSRWGDAEQAAGRLEKEVPGLRVELAAARNMAGVLRNDLAERLRLLETERARAEMAEQARDGLLEERARLREALKPFAANVHLLASYTGSDPDRLVQMGITAYDCKRAAEALGQPQAQETLPLRTPETAGRIAKHLERCPEHPMRELEQTSRQLAKAIAEADAALGEFASHHPREDGFHPFPRCVEEAMGTLRGRISRLEADGARFRGALGGLGVTGGGYCWCATQEQAAAGHAGECRGAAMAMGMTELRNNLWTIAAPVEGGQ